MEIPVINFEASICSLNNPSFLSRLLSTFEIGKLSQAHKLWKWGALFLALVYAFNYVVYKIKTLVSYYHARSKSFLSNTEPLLSSTFDELYSSDDEDDDVCDSSSDEEDEIIEDVGNFSYDDLTKFEYDFGVKGQKRKFKVSRRRRSIGDDFSLCDLVHGSSVVKLWDGVERSLSFLDLSKIPAVSVSSSVVMTAAGGEAGLLGLSLWDLRCSRSEPVVNATWRSDQKGRVVGADVNQTGRVFVGDDVTRGVAVGDIRKAGSPVKEYEEDVDTWSVVDDIGTTKK